MMPRFGLATAFGVLLGVTAALIVVKQQRVGGSQGGGSTTGTAATVTGTAAIGGPFQLVNTDGQQVGSESFAGKHMLVYFGFTNCPDICPAGLQQISAALDKIGPAADQLAPLFISLDPERDTPEKLKAYMKSFHANIVGLTGAVEAVGTAAKAYRVYYKKIENETSPANYSVDHSGFMYLMGRDGQYLKHFRHNVDANQLAEAIRAVIKPAP
jgi:protein SCO1